MQFRTFAAAFCLFVISQTCFAEVFTAITPTVCPSSSAGLFTTGQQYVDSGNGVLQNSWSMLVRWQGNPTVGNTSWYSNPMSYNGGLYTGYTPPTPYSSWQRGYIPESGAAQTPGVQLHCFDAGMLINSWATPHAGARVAGGYFNDMYGYAWGATNKPNAFLVQRNGAWVQSELVIQANLGVPYLNGWTGLKQADGSYAFTPVTNLNDNLAYADTQLAFFVYVQDTIHPSLHPIAMLAGVFDNGIVGTYACPTYGNVNYDYSGGVWYASSQICTTDVTTLRYGSLPTGTPFSGQRFFRVHITPQNLINAVNRINAQQCAGGTNNSCVPGLPGASCNPGVGCPLNGYSTNPSAYQIQYVGIIAEVAPCDRNGTNVFCSTNLRDSTQPNYNPGQDSNVTFGINASGVSAFAYTSN